MKRFFTILASLCLCSCLWAQVSLDDVVKRLYLNRIEAEFSCKYNTGKAVLSYKGSVTAQGNCFVSNINGVESYCNSERLVMLDKENQEAYIEKAYGLEEYFKANIKNISDLQFHSLRFLDKSDDMSAFEVDTKSLGKDWVITDLRQE